MFLTLGFQIFFSIVLLLIEYLQCFFLKKFFEKGTIFNMQMLSVFLRHFQLYIKPLSPFYLSPYQRSQSLAALLLAESSAIWENRHGLQLKNKLTFQGSEVSSYFSSQMPLQPRSIPASSYLRINLYNGTDRIILNYHT